MAQTRLLEVRHGGATTVRDYRRHAGLDLLPALLVRGGSVDVAAVRSVVEARLRDRARGRGARRRPSYRRAGRAADRDRRGVRRLRRRRRAAALRARLLGPRRRRRRLDHLPADVQQPARGLRAGPRRARPRARRRRERRCAYRVLTAALGEGDPDTARAAAERVLRPSTDAAAAAALDAVEEDR